MRVSAYRGFTAFLLQGTMTIGMREEDVRYVFRQLPIVSGCEVHQINLQIIRKP